MHVVFSIDTHGSVCINVDLHTLHTKNDIYKWQLGPCQASHKYSQIGTYTEKCCVPNGDHLLSCKNKQHDGWVDTAVTIGKHRFCDDSVGYNQLIKLNIQGESNI